jgi:hypothetical protein
MIDPQNGNLIQESKNVKMIKAYGSCSQRPFSVTLPYPELVQTGDCTIVSSLGPFKNAEKSTKPLSMKNQGLRAMGIRC